MIGCGSRIAGVFKMIDQEMGEVYYHLQIDPSKDPTGAAFQHELLHLGAMLNGQKERPWYLFLLDMPHEQSVSWSTTPKLAAGTTALNTLISAVAGYGSLAFKEYGDAKRQAKELEQSSAPGPMRKPVPGRKAPQPRNPSAGAVQPR